MNISNPLNRLRYWVRWYRLVVTSKFFGSKPYLRYQARKRLKDATSETTITQEWHIGSLRVAVLVAAFVLVLGGVFVFELDFQVSGLSNGMRSRLTDYVGILWQVQAGLLSVGFVVVILLMQVLGGRDQLSGYVFKEYVRRSGVLTVAFLGLSSIAVMGVTALSVAYSLRGTGVSVPVVVFNSVLLGVNLIAVGFVYWRTVRFITPSHSISLTAELLKRNLQRNFQKLVLEAFAEHLLMEMRGFDYSPTFPRQGNPVEVEYPVENHTVHVRDVDLARLRDVSETLNREQSTGPKGWIRAKIGTTLSVSNPHVGYVRSEVTDSDAERFLNCFVVEEVTDTESGWEASAEHLKNRANRAVTERQSSELSDLLDVYVDTLRHYSRYVQQYDSEALSLAFDDPLSMNEYWRPDKRLYRDFRDLGRRAVKEDDRDLLQSVLYLPIRVMRLAQSRSNPDLFHDFAGTYVQFYNVAHSLPPNSDARRFILDRSWRHLRDYGRRMSFRYLDRPDRAHDIIENAPYAHLILKVFNRLMKRALDLRDEDSLLTFLRKFNTVFDDLAQTRMQLQTESLRIERKTNQSESRELENFGPDEASVALRVLEKAEEAAENVSTTKSLIRFGITAWILDLYQRDQVNKTQMGRLVAETSDQFDDLEALYQIYMTALDAAWNDQFRWDIWDDQRHDRGDGIEFGAVTTKSWLRRFYVVKGLQIVQPGATESNLSPTPELKTELGKLRETCASITEDGHPIQDLDNLEERRKTFIRLHDDALRKQEQKETDQLIEAELDQDRVESFKAAFLEAWEENSVDQLLAPFSSIKVTGADKDDSVDDRESSIRIPAQPKRCFTDQSHGDVAPRLGEQTGRRLGWIERKVLSRVLKQELPTETTKKEQLTKQVEEILGESDFQADLLLIGQRMMVSEFFLSNSKFVAKHRGEHSQSGLPGYKGRFGSVPVCSVGIDEICALVLNTDGITLRRVVRGDGQVFQVKIQNVTENRAEKLLDEQPSLRNEGESRRQVIRRLRQHVMVEKGGGKFDFEIDGETGIVLRVENEEQE